MWKETDIFAFPSHHEGFPLALTEAMGVGIPAVGYRSCPAVNELIHDGEDGYLTDDGAAPFAEALRNSWKMRIEGRPSEKGEGTYEALRSGSGVG